MAIQSLMIILIVLLGLLALGVPIAYSIGISSLVAILQVIPLDVAVVTGAQRTFVGMSKFSLTAIPFFILAGNLMNQGGIAKRLVDFVMALLGKLPGALLVTNAGANALFGAISGSASAAAAAVGSMVKGGEEEQGYDKALCAATNGASAPSGLFQRVNYLLPGIRRNFGCSFVYGRIYSRYFVDNLLYYRWNFPCKENGLQGFKRQI